jgi:cytochrome b6-f complex iron-sulfur subunit
MSTDSVTQDLVKKESAEAMNRKAFLTLFGTGAAAIIGAACLGGCKATSGPAVVSQPATAPGSPQSPEAAKPAMTLDLASAAAADLDNPAKGYVYLSNGAIIVAKTTSGEYIALEGKCTHEQGPMQYKPGNNQFMCPWHRSYFDASGAVISGAARRPLKKYSVVRNGNTIQIQG